MKKTLTIAIVVFGLAACKKEVIKTRLQGKVLNYKTGLPIENVQVYYGQYFYGITIMFDARVGEESNNFKMLTDIEGNFSFDYRAMRKGDFHISFNKENFYWFGAELNGKNDFGGIYYIAPFSYYKVHVKNVNPVNNKDKFDGGGFDDELLGMDIDTISESIKFPYYMLDENYTLEKAYSYSVIRNNQISYYQMNITGIVGDTVVYDIFY